MRKLLIVALFVALAAPLAAQDRPSARSTGGNPFDLDVEHSFLFETMDAKGRPAAHAMRQVARFLGLTEEQVASWQGLLEDRRLAAEPKLEQIKDNNAALKALLNGDGPDATEVGNLVIANVGLHQDLGDIHRTYVESFQGQLDEDQLRKLNLIRRAARLQPLIPAFRMFGLVGG
jgi:hypothetical protein